MITIALFAWILFQLNAPTWCYVLLAISFVIRALQYGVNMYKKGMESHE